MARLPLVLQLRRSPTLQPVCHALVRYPIHQGDDTGHRNIEGVSLLLTCVSLKLGAPWLGATLYLKIAYPACEKPASAPNILQDWACCMRLVQDWLAISQWWSAQWSSDDKLATLMIAALFTAPVDNSRSLRGRRSDSLGAEVDRVA